MCLQRSASGAVTAQGEEAGFAGKWLEVVSRVDASFGGISALMPQLCESATAAGTQVSIAAFCFAREDTYDIERQGVPFCRFPLGTMRWRRGMECRKRLAALLQVCEGVHIHGIWDEHCALSGAMARSAHKPYIVSAHGMLDRWAIRHKWLKKRLYSLFVESTNLRKATCLHALTRAETADYRRYGLKNPIAMIPNGVDVPSTAVPEMFLEQYPQLKNKRIVLFLSRMHYKKGLDILCKAWTAASAKFPEAHLVLAGPDCDNIRSVIQRRVEELGIGATVSFTGMLRGAMKWSALSAAELFVLPSYSEGFSVAVLEAMGMGVPVLISRPCNFPEVAEEGCGLVIDPTARDLQEALFWLLSANSSELAKMGSRGRKLVASRFTWSAIGHQIAELYNWVSGGPKPTLFPVFE